MKTYIGIDLTMSDFKQIVVVLEIINYNFLPLMMRNFLFSVNFWYSKAYTILKQLDGDNQRYMFKDRHKHLKVRWVSFIEPRPLNQVSFRCFSRPVVLHQASWYSFHSFKDQDNWPLDIGTRVFFEMPQESKAAFVYLKRAHHNSRSLFSFSFYIHVIDCF